MKAIHSPWAVLALAAVVAVAPAHAGPRSSDNFTVRCERLGTALGTGTADGQTLHSRITTGQVVTLENGLTITGGTTNALVPLPPEDGPDDLSGRSKSSQVALSWTAKPAARYQVLRGDAAGGPYLPVATVDGGYFLDIVGVSSGTFHYVVRADYGCEVSRLSNEATVTLTTRRRGR